MTVVRGEPAAPAASRRRVSIQDTSAWILRVGVVLSVAVMLSGLAWALSSGGVTVHQMQTRTFATDLHGLARDVVRFEPFGLMELGVVLLILTPIVRVLAAMILFIAEERDRLYAAMTFLVLLMTVSSLLFIK